jgi:hypothetical protein
MSNVGAYPLRKGPGAGDFAWDEGRAGGVEPPADIAYERADYGVPVPVLRRASRSVSGAGSATGC